MAKTKVELVNASKLLKFKFIFDPIKGGRQGHYQATNDQGSGERLDDRQLNLGRST